MLEPNWKKISMYIALTAAMLGIMVSWQQLDFLPRWAWYEEVANVQEFAKDTRVLVLNQEWFRLKSKLHEQEAKLSEQPFNRELIEEVTRLEQQLKAVETQLQRLGKNGE